MMLFFLTKKNTVKELTTKATVQFIKNTVRTDLLYTSVIIYWVVLCTGKFCSSGGQNIFYMCVYCIG